MHSKTDFDVDIRYYSSRAGQISWKTFCSFTLSTEWTNISSVEKTFKPRSYRTGIYEGTTVIIKFCDFMNSLLDTPRNPTWWLISKPYLHNIFFPGLFLTFFLHFNSIIVVWGLELGFWGCGFLLMRFWACGVGPSGVFGVGALYISI